MISGLLSNPRIDGRTGAYTLTEGSPLLGGMPFPDNTGIWNDLYALGYSGIVCLTHDRAPYDPAPLRVLGSFGLRDLCGGIVPDNPVDEAVLYRVAVSAVFDELEAGGSVVVHCMGGTGRTGTVLAAALRESGLSWKDTVGVMEKVNRIRGREGGHGWPESDWQESLVKEWNDESK